MNDYRVEMTVRNNRIYTYIRDLGFNSVASFCREHGLNDQVVGQFLNMKIPAVTKANEWSQPALKLAAALACEPDDLWSDAQRIAALASNKREITLSEEEAARYLTDTPEAATLAIECRDSIERALDSLEPLEQKVLRMRYGLQPYGDAHHLYEIGEVIGRSTETVRSIQMKALRKLRHPKVTTLIKDFA